MRLIIIGLLLATLTMGASALEAQDAVVTGDIVTPGQVWTQVLTVLALFSAGTGILSQGIVSLVKVVLARVWRGGLDYLTWIALGVPVALTLLFWAADAMGYASLYGTIAEGVNAVIPLIISVLGATGAQAATYMLNKKANTPLLGKTKEQLME